VILTGIFRPNYGILCSGVLITLHSACVQLRFAKIVLTVIEVELELLFRKTIFQVEIKNFNRREICN
jgi:hypothetical protein